MTSKYAPKHSNAQYLSSVIVYVFFAIFIFFFISKVVQSELLYFKLQPFFSTDKAYLEFHHNFRMGFISVTAQYILQFLYFPLGGAIILTFLFLLVSFAFRLIFNKSFPSILNGAEFIPVFIILLSLKNYSEVINTFILFGLSIIILLFNHLINNQRIYFRMAYHLVAIVFSFNIFGFLASLMVLVGLISYEIINKKTYKEQILLIVINVLTLAYMVWYIEGTLLAKLSFIEASASNKYAQLPSYWYLLSFYPVIILFTILFNLRVLEKMKEKASKLIPLHWYFIILFIVISGLSFKKKLLNDNKYIVLIDYYAHEEKWDKVLKLKDHLALNDRIPRFQINRALYHKGIMPDNLFSVSQEWGENSLLLTNNATRECTMNSSDLFFDMGFINGSRYWAYEAQTFAPYSPRVLQRLAITNMILKENILAQKYLTILYNNTIYKSWANQYLKLYKTNETAEITKKLSVYPKANSDSITYINNNFPARDIIRLLKSNPENKMAFEYLMSYVLLRNELNNFQYFLLYSNYYPNGVIPRTYQEAMIFFYFSKNLNPTKQYFKISKTCMKQFEDFNKILMEYKMDKNLAQKNLHRYFGDTFWYYIAFDSPLVTNRKVKKRKL